MNWDTTNIDGDAHRKFELSRSMHTQGREILDEIAKIGRWLKEMESIIEITISSPNNCTWRPSICQNEVRQFVECKLDERRTELQKKFNRMFKD